ncbi:MAG TPA: tetratricopeptide repeat protein, partial [Noviherbaspirillum sp.]|nr:tetratricopeptide repeat protein [Noviherbaspirillum sp.]
MLQQSDSRLKIESSSMKRHSNNTTADLEKALLLHRAGRLQEAEIIYKKMPHDPDALHLRGVLAHQLNRNNEAVELISQAIRAQPSNAAYYYSLDTAYRALNQLEEVSASYQRLLERTPDNPVVWNRLGNAIKDQGMPAEAATCYQNAIALKPDFSEAYNNMGILFADQGELDTAIECYQQALKLNPGDAATYANLSIAFSKQHRLDEAAACCRKALELKPDFGPALINLGNVLQNQGKLEGAANSYLKALAFNSANADAHCGLGMTLGLQGKHGEAIRCYQTAIALRPKFPEAYAQMGATFTAQGQLNEAIACHQQTLAMQPDSAEAHNNLGTAFKEVGKYEDAISCYLNAIARKPDFPEAFNNLSIIFSEQANLDQAESCCRKAIELRPSFFEAYANLGTILHAQGKTDDALSCYQKALELKPDFVGAFFSMLLTMQYSSSFTPEQMFAEHVRFGAQFEAPLKAGWSAHANAPDPGKRLRIGYVSPDFRRHAVAYFIEPVLACHDKTQVEVFCYYNHTQHDPVTARLQALADHWIPCRYLSDDQLAQRIRADGIDILVDLAGHTRDTRLLAFARKPAPVQVAYLGYPATTGLSAIDYRITDVHAEPPGMTEHLNVEQLWRLPEFFCVYRPGDNSPDVIDHPPADDNGFVTFGCFNNFAKVTDPVLTLWAKLLQQVPDARLLLEIHGINDAALRAEIEARLARLGLPPERVLLEPRRPENQYMLYNRIDIALDPFPQNGGTTSIDTLWMGVPFVTLAGRHFSSRMGATILANAKLGELIAASEDEYV